LHTNEAGFARIDVSGVGSYVSAVQAAGDTGIASDSHSCAPALSNDGSTLYVVVKYSTSPSSAYLVALDSATLVRKSRVRLADPRTGSNLIVLDDSTASPMVAPDGDVFFG